MSEKSNIGRLVSPTNMWARPLPPAFRGRPAQAEKPKEDEKMLADDDDIMEDDDIDVDAALESAEESPEEADDAALVAIETDADSELEDDDNEPEDEEPDYDAEDGDVKDDAVMDEIVAGTEEANDDEDEETEHVAEVAEGDSDVYDAENDDSSDLAENVTAKADRQNLKKKGKRTVAATKAGTKMSISDHVRAEIAKREKSGASLRGKDIVAALAAKDVNVNPAQVSQLLKKAGLSKPRGAKPAETAEADTVRAAPRRKPTEATPPRTMSTPKPGRAPRIKVTPRAKTTGSMSAVADQLLAAEEFVTACGGSVKRASQVLSMFDALSQDMND